MIDLLGFLTGTLSRRQQESQFGRSLAEQQADRALKERLAQAEMAQQESQFGRNLGQRSNEFTKTFGLDEKRLAQAAAESEANRKLQESQLLGNLADKFSSPDLLNLLGQRYGLPGLGYRTNFNNASSGYAPSRSNVVSTGVIEPSLYDRSMQRIRDFVNRSWPS